MGDTSQPIIRLILIGSELTEGRRSDRHARYLAAQLDAMGCAVVQITLLPDHRDSMRQAMSDAFARSDAVIITGGLGPTSDDITRDVISEVVDAPLEYSNEIWEGICSYLGDRNINQTNRRQAMAPRSFAYIQNMNGTAPGLMGSYGACSIFALPGPPRELRPMFERSVVPELERLFSLARPNRLHMTIFFTPESELEEALRERSDESLRWSTQCGRSRIALFLYGDEDAANHTAVRLLRRLGPIRAQFGACDPARLAFEQLERHRAIVSVAESCTGGGVMAALTGVAGCSRVLWGGGVVYRNDAKERVVGARRDRLDQYGAVSEEIALDMARGALAMSEQATLAIAITGLAGPEGATDSLPVGTVYIAVVDRAGKVCNQRLLFRGDRKCVQKRAVMAALFMIAHFWDDPAPSFEALSAR